LILAIRKVGTGAKMGAHAAQHGKPCRLVSRKLAERPVQLGQHGAIEGIAAIRPVQLYRRDSARGHLHGNRFEWQSCLLGIVGWV
jgi:hypothetical protein